MLIGPNTTIFSSLSDEEKSLLALGYVFGDGGKSLMTLTPAEVEAEAPVGGWRGCPPRPPWTRPSKDPISS
jgi:hypothetical protein